MRTRLIALAPLALLAAVADAKGSLTADSRTVHQVSDPLAAAIQPFVDRHALAGAVMLVADRDRVLDLCSVGYSDIAANKPMPTDAVFWIASQSKPVTATALMMLVDEGKVHLDDPVAKYLPEFYGVWVRERETGNELILARPKHSITVRELLSHTSGLRPVSPMEQPTLDLLPLRVSVLSYANTPLEFEPGTKYQYSNAGINTVGRIIEVVSGMPYERFLSERLFKPLGMKDTTFVPNRRQIALLAKSYRPDAAKTGLEETAISQVRYPLNDPGRFPFPAGGLFSTASDYCRFCQMILNGGVYRGKRLVSEASVREMTRKQTGDAIPESYGLGWGVNGDGSFGHGGAYSTNFTIDPRRGLVFIWMVQHAGFPKDGNQSFGAFLKAAIDRYGAGRS